MIIPSSLIILASDLPVAFSRSSSCLCAQTESCVTLFPSPSLLLAKTLKLLQLMEPWFLDFLGLRALGLLWGDL